MPLMWRYTLYTVTFLKMYKTLFKSKLPYAKRYINGSCLVFITGYKL